MVGTVQPLTKDYTAAVVCCKRSLKRGEVEGSHRWLPPTVFWGLGRLRGGYCSNRLPKDVRFHTR